MILLVGATGMVGGEVCRQLAAEGKLVRALVRATSDSAKVEGLRSLGVDVVEGDLRDPASLERACRDVEAVINTASALPLAYVPDVNTPDTTDRDGVLSLVDAAARAGVSHFVYVSFVSYDPQFPLQDAKRAVEERLRSSGMTYTILRPTYFDEIWLSPIVGFDYANGKAAVFGDGQSPVSWISFRDVAAFAVAALTNPAARNATIELGGPEALSPLQVVSIFERVGGKQWETAHVPVEALRGQFEAATDPLQKSLGGLTLGVTMGSVVDMGETLRHFPLRLSSVEDYARQVLSAAPEQMAVA